MEWGSFSAGYVTSDSMRLWVRYGFARQHFVQCLA